MLVLNLRCEHDHHFEGWFGSAADFESQIERGLLACPVCGNLQITRMPTAPHLNVSHLRSASRAKAESQAEQGQPTPTLDPAISGRSEEQQAASPMTASLQALQRTMLQAVAHVLASTDDVGDRFAEEARRIHYGETAAHGIRGQATAAEVAELHDEGIDVLALPLPAPLKEPLQ